jgi:lipoprotein signal peptidase
VISFFWIFPGVLAGVKGLSDGNTGIFTPFPLADSVICTSFLLMVSALIIDPGFQKL